MRSLSLSLSITILNHAYSRSPISSPFCFTPSFFSSHERSSVVCTLSLFHSSSFSFFFYYFKQIVSKEFLKRIFEELIKRLVNFLKIIWLSENSRTHQASFYLLLSLHRSLLHLCKLWLSWNWLTIAKQEHGLQHYSFRGSWGMKTWLICRDRMQLWKCLCVRHCVYTAMWSFFLVFR